MFQRILRTISILLAKFDLLELILVITIVVSMGWLTAFAVNHHTTSQSANFKTTPTNEDAESDELKSSNAWPEAYRDEAQKRGASSDPSATQPKPKLGPNFLLDEMRSVAVLAPLADDPAIRHILNFSGQNPDDLYSNASRSQQVEMTSAATKVVLSITACLKTPADCGVEDLGHDYMTMGAHPLHLALERALMIEKLAEGDHLTGADGLTNGQIADVLSVQQHNVAVLAIDLLTSRQLTSDDLQQIWEKGPDVKGHAKVLYFKMLGDYLQSDEKITKGFSSPREGFVKELERTIADKNDAWTAVKIVSSVENFKLTEAEFQKVARHACDIPVWATEEDSRMRLLDSVESQARRMNYCLETNSGSTCSKSKPVHLTPANYCEEEKN